MPFVAFARSTGLLTTASSIRTVTVSPPVGSGRDSTGVSSLAPAGDWAGTAGATTGALLRAGESIVAARSPLMMSRWRSPAVIKAMDPGRTSSRAPPSVVATSTTPSVTWSALLSAFTLTEKTVPLTTAARNGVSTENRGVPRFSTLNTALPISWKNRVRPLSPAWRGILIRLFAATVTKSFCWTRTARPPAPVTMASPGWTTAPRVAACRP